MKLFVLQLIVAVFCGLAMNALAGPCYGLFCDDDYYYDDSEPNVYTTSVNDYTPPSHTCGPDCNCQIKCYSVKSCPPGYYMQYATAYNGYNCDTCVSYSATRMNCQCESCEAAVCDPSCQYLVPADGIKACCSYCEDYGKPGEFCDDQNPCKQGTNCVNNVCQLNCPAIVCCPPECKHDEILVRADYVTSCCDYCQPRCPTYC